MAKFVGIDDLTRKQLAQEIQNGTKFVYYMYTVSIIIMTFRRSSSIYFIRSGHNATKRGLPFTLISFFLGWWGIPWGPIYTIQALVKNLSGGVDITKEVVAAFADPDLSTSKIEDISYSNWDIF
ncbi:MAG: hypothetical protein LBP92_12440 [Deltaproteobacteria bacterium]|jgi:hypothetical protein|nr:hypothetical protein [Deltaproteobacteria bacterium]